MAELTHLTFSVPLIVRVTLTPKAVRNLPAATVQDVIMGAVGDQIDLAAMNRFIHNAIVRKETFSGDEIEAYQLNLSPDDIEILTLPPETDED